MQNEDNKNILIHDSPVKVEDEEQINQHKVKESQLI